MKKVYSFSEESIKQRKKHMILTIIIMSVAMVIFTYFLINIKAIHNIRMFVTIISITLIFLIIEILIVSSILFRKLRTMEMLVTENGLTRRGGKFEETLLFYDLIKVKVSREPSGKIAIIKLKTRKKSINIIGFENLEYLLEDISNNVEDSSLIVEKKWKYNWNSPMFSFCCAVIVILILVLLMKLRLDIYYIFNELFMIGLGIFVIIYRPISKNAGRRFRVLEVVVGTLILVGSVIGLLGDIL